MGRYDRSSRDSDRDPALDAVPALPACVAFDGTRYQAAGVSQLRDDALGGDAVEEDGDADAAHAADRDGVAGVRAVRVPVVRADGGVAGAVREPGVLVAVLAPGAGAWGRGGGMTDTDRLDRIEALLLTLAGRMDMVTVQVAQLATQLDALTLQVDRLVRAIVTGFTQRDSRLATIEQRLDELDALVQR